MSSCQFEQKPRLAKSHGQVARLRHVYQATCRRVLRHQSGILHKTSIKPSREISSLSVKYRLLRNLEYRPACNLETMASRIGSAVQRIQIGVTRQKCDDPIRKPKTSHSWLPDRLVGTSPSQSLHPHDMFNYPTPTICKLTDPTILNQHSNSQPSTHNIHRSVRTRTKKTHRS